MISVNEAVQILTDNFHSLKPEPIPFENALGRVLAEDVHADQDYPSFDNSSMDGIALLAKDVASASQETPVELKLIGSIPAGNDGEITVSEGSAVQIMTGAPVPPGADLVLPVEVTNLDFSNNEVPTRVQIFKSAEAGDYIRRQGENYKQGDILLTKGNIVRAQDVGLFSLVGKSEVLVSRKPRIGLLATGDELITPGEALLPGKIRDTNTPMLKALLAQHGAEVIHPGILKDDLDVVQAALDNLVSQEVDLIVTSGGVSVGAYDVIRQVLEAHGKINFWKVNIKPGKPLAFGSYKDVPVIGLPGNPVSSFVGLHVFIHPVLNKLLGRTTLVNQEQVPAQLTHDAYGNPRQKYSPAALTLQDGQYTVGEIGNQSSGNLYSLVQANSLIIFPPGVKFFKQGETVQVWKLQ